MAFESSADEGIPLLRRTPRPNLWIWTIPVLGVAAGHLLTMGSSPVLRMLVITGLLFMAMKAVTLSVVKKGQGPGAENLLWFLFWPGMRPDLFNSRSGNKNRGAPALLREASFRFLLGLGFLVLVHLSFPAVLKMLFVMAGWSLVLHFGVFAFLTVFYQSKGWRVRQPFFNPWQAGSLADFWGQRWNRAFSEMLVQSVYRPLVSSAGHRVAVLAAFAVSGLLHEAAIILPVRSGFGGPLCYFLLQGIFVLLEGDRRNVVSVQQRLRVFLSIVLPLPLLFPPVFIREVLLAMAGVVL